MTRASPPLRSIAGAIGNTPIVRLEKLVPPDSAEILVKLESLNPSGSYKDRLALGVVEAAEARGDLRPGMTIVDYTAGSTGAALALVCGIKGYRCVMVTSDAYSAEKLSAMRALGAEVIVVHSEGGVIDRHLIGVMMKEAMRLADSEGYYYIDQHHNPDAVASHTGLGRELLEQLPDGFDAFCAGFGTGAMAMGVGRVLREHSPATEIVLLEPLAAAVLSSRRPTSHRLEGVGYGFIPFHLDTGLYDSVRAVPEALARQTARRLAKEEGILAGTTTGLNVTGALELAAELGPGRVVVTVCCDTGLKYLSGDLFIV